jgi:toxin ParE1/3/4
MPIWWGTLFTLNKFGPVQAERYISGLSEFLTDLPTHKHRLRPVKTTVGSYKRAVFRSHVAFVREADDALIVIRILHDKMDPANYLPPL